MNTLTVKKLPPETKMFIAQAVRDVLADPDFGLQLSAHARKRLAQAKKLPRKTISLSSIKNKYY